LTNERPSLQLEWDSYNTTLLLGKIARDVERTRTPSEVTIKPGSLETIVHLGLTVTDVGLIAASLYRYIKQRRKKVPTLKEPAINTEFLVQMTSWNLRKMARTDEMQLVSLDKDDSGTRLTFVDEYGRKHHCLVGYSGQIESYDGPAHFKHKRRKHKR
jgi:hypothetical protein